MKAADRIFRFGLASCVIITFVFSVNRYAFKNRALLACIVGVTLFTLSASGQQRTVPESEIDALLKNAAGLRKSLSHRVTRSIFVAKAKAEEKRTSIDVYEFVPPDRSRWVYEYGPSAPSELTIEEIVIGDRRFYKKKSGEWVAIGLEPFVPKDEFDIPWEYGGGTVASFECRYTGGSQLIDGNALRVYQKIKTINYKERPGNPVRTVTRTYWFDKRGLLVKLVNDQEDSANGGNRLRWVYESDYDSTIKIEAPIITK